jgi:transposase, IS5 family
MGRKAHQRSFAQAQLEQRVGLNSTLTKVNALIDWEAIRSQCEGLHKREQGQSCKGGQTPFDGVMLFKALLLGQWHSLSDPKLEQALRVRLDFMQFCDLGLDDEIPDESTLCRARNRLVAAGRMDGLLAAVNAQLQGHGLMVKNAQAAVIDATLISSAARPYKGKWLIEGQASRSADEQPEEGEETELGDECDERDERQRNSAESVVAVEAETLSAAEQVQSADKEARWVKKGSKSVHGYRGYVAVDEGDGYIRAVHSAPANGCEMHHFAPTLAKLTEHDFKPKRVYADKGFSSKANRVHLRRQGIKSAIMHKAGRNRPLSERKKQANVKMSKTRWIVEQGFGTMKRLFGFTRASYFGTAKVNAQLTMKSLCVNLLKAANKLSVLGKAQGGTGASAAGSVTPKLGLPSA